MTALKRSITLPMLTLYGLGTILGAGIFVLVGKVAIFAGIYAPFAFLLAALLAGLTGYSYAALSSRFPKSAGEAVYIQHAFGLSKLSTLVGWMVVLTGVVSASTISIGFVGYLQVFINISDFWAVTLLILSMTTLAFWGVQESVLVTAITTVMGIVGLILILGFSFPAFMTIPERLPELVPPLFDGGIWFGIVLGAFLAFYAFIGFEDMVNMAEEVKNAKQNLPKAIVAAIFVSSLFYFFIALAAVLQLSQEALVQSKAPMSDIMNEHDPNMAKFISLISLAAVVNGALVQIIMGARVLYGMAKQSLAPDFLARVHPKRKTPHIATVIIGLVVWILATSFEITSLAKFTSFIIIAVFLLVNLALIITVKKEKELPQDAMAVSNTIPVLASLMCVVFLGVQIYQVFTGAQLAGH